MAKRKEIRNSTAEFLIFQAEDKGQGIEVIYKNENVWCTQKAMATLFDCSTDNVGKVSAEQAKAYAETEFEKYRVIQDRLFRSDFDNFTDMLPFEDKE